MAEFLPAVGVGAIVRRGDAVLLVQRGRSPHAGEWAIPGGRVRAGESLRNAAEREILEETGVTIRAGEPVYAFELIDRDSEGGLRYHYVVVDLAAEFVAGEPLAGDDAADAAWVSLSGLSRLPINRTSLEALTKLYPGDVG